MIFTHSQYLCYDLPDDWINEYDTENLIFYNPNGNGAITISFFNILNVKETLDEQISILAKNFIDRNSIKLHRSLILLNKENKTILYGTGTTSDGWFIKIWVVAKSPKIVFATYQSQKKTDEVKVCDSIIDSFKFVF